MFALQGAVSEDVARLARALGVRLRPCGPRSTRGGIGQHKALQQAGSVELAVCRIFGEAGGGDWMPRTEAWQSAKDALASSTLRSQANLAPDQAGDQAGVHM